MLNVLTSIDMSIFPPMFMGAVESTVRAVDEAAGINDEVSRIAAAALLCTARKPATVIASQRCMQVYC